MHAAVLAARVEEQGRVALHAVLLAQRTVLIAVHLGDVQLVPHVRGKLGPDGCEFLAVAAPVKKIFVTGVLSF